MTGNTPRDLLGRPWHDLRISVMDRCNFRCPYCMPASVFHEDFAFLPASARLDFEQIERVARVSAGLGVTKLRLTGGEPLLRPGLDRLVSRLAALPGIEEIALTTNGVLLDRHARMLRAAGLSRLTISLDSLDPTVFTHMSGGRNEVEHVLDNLDHALSLGFPGGIKINTVVQRSVNEDSVLPLVDRFRGTGVILRFIEYMDVGTRNGWERRDVVPSAELVRRIGAQWPLVPLAPHYRGEVARRYRFEDGRGEIGFISSVTAPFCGDCSRARLSSDGRFYTCLFTSEGADLRPALTDATDEILRHKLIALWQGRRDRYSEERRDQGTGTTDSDPDGRIEMYYIGG